MPSANNKIEKPASAEVQDPVKQGIVLIEHKVRNLMKKKGRLDSYREIESSGKELIPDQKLALTKYDELCQNLAFAQELSKQFNTILVDWGKLQKKKEKKEAYEREQQETVKVKEILIIQDVLAGMGHDSVREDFLAGRNKAVKLTETELQYLDELFVEVSPKRDPEENQPSFLEQAQNAAKHLLSIVENKDKEVIGTKYSTLKDLIEKINSCGYFDPSSAQEPAVQDVAASEQQPLDIVEPQADQIEPDPVVQSATYQPAEEQTGLEPAVPPGMETAGLYISQRPMADVLTNVMGTGPTTFNFIQESQIEPDVAVVAAPLPIPTQTFTNASFVPSTAAVPPQEVPYTASTHVQYNAAQPQPLPQLQPTPTQTFENNAFQNAPQGGAGDWSENTTEQSDWAMAVEQSEQTNSWNEPTQQQGDDWTDNNDGFQPATRGSNRGGRGRGGSGSERGRGGSRGGRGYQNGRGNYGNNQNGRGGGYHNRNNEGGYQNGYQPRSEGDRPYRGDRDGERSFRGDRDGDRSYRGDRDGDRSYRGDRDGDRSYRGDRDGDRSYRGDRDGDRSYRGDRDGGPRRGGPRGGGGQDRGGPRGAPRGGGNRGGNNARGTRGNRQ